MLDLAASIRARLLNLAKERQEDFQFVLTRYGNERLLYRLSISSHAQQFVLKGASLLSLWFDEPYRATRDIDLLGFGTPDVQRLHEIARDLCAVDVDDGLIFNPSTISVAPIRADSIYQGIRTTFRATLARARLDLQIDIGFGDAPVPSPRRAVLPTLLDLPRPSLRVYAKETVIAEKFEAMVTLGLTNSRMKDYFDVWLLAESCSFDSALITAIQTTFDRRLSELPQSLPPGLSDDFIIDSNKQSQWRAFLHRAHLSVRPSLHDVVHALRLFFQPILNPQTPVSTWPPKGPWRP